jgi:hypothetical protein
MALTSQSYRASRCNRDGFLNSCDFGLARTFALHARQYTHEDVTLFVVSLLILTTGNSLFNGAIASGISVFCRNITQIDRFASSAGRAAAILN